MPDYKKMYFQLFNSVTDTIHLLQQAQQWGEDSYIEDDEIFDYRAEHRQGNIELTQE